MIICSKVNKICVYLFLLIAFSTGCSSFKSNVKEKDSDASLDTALKNIEDKTYVKLILHNNEADQGQFLDIENIYSKFAPDSLAFEELFKKSLPNRAYRLYKQEIEKKVASLKAISTGVKYKKAHIFSKERVSRRKAKVKKEWIWGKEKKEKMREYYKYFRKPGSTFEYKIIFNSVVAPPTKEDLEEAKEKDIKLERKGKSIVIYLYQRKNNKFMYVVDPDIFIDSVL